MIYLGIWWERGRPTVRRMLFVYLPYMFDVFLSSSLGWAKRGGGTAAVGEETARTEDGR